MRALRGINCLIALAAVLLFGSAAAAHAQAYYCKQSVLKTLSSIPKITYDCPEGKTDYDDSILKMSERAKALRKFAGELESLDNPAWWAATVNDITYCEIHKKAGRLTKEEI